MASEQQAWRTHLMLTTETSSWRDWTVGGESVPAQGPGVQIEDWGGMEARCL